MRSTTTASPTGIRRSSSPSRITARSGSITPGGHSSLCAELGAPHITTEPGGPLAPGPVAAGGDRPVRRGPQAAGRARPRPGRLAPDRARARPAAGDDRPVPGGRRATECPVDRPELRRRPRVLRAAKTCPGRSPSWRPHIRHYHLEDIAASRVHHHLVPGTGAIDFAEVVAAIRATGYDGWLTVELYPFLDDPDAAAARRSRSAPAGRTRPGDLDPSGPCAEDSRPTCN